jgi:glutamate/tyrosine decarboxylase-like PLP-dependent enzyme
MDTDERLAELRRLGSQLEPDAAERSRKLDAVARHAEIFLDELPGRPIYTVPGDRDAALREFSLSDEATPITEVLSTLDRQVDRVGYNLGASGFFGYIPSGGLYDSALADYLAAVINKYAGVGFSAPGATRMEESLLRWLAGVLGYPDTAEGDLTSGGSMAALSAILVARESFGIRSKDVGRHVIYLTTQTHHTFRKALFVAGLSDCVVREVALDERYRMRIDSLQRQIAEDRQAGLLPWFIAASAGTTDVGAVDPLDEIADIASTEGLWFHVDAAYGGAFALCEPGKKRLHGIERSDSLILDPHKGFFLPCGTGVVLIRDGEKLAATFRARGIYMQDVASDPERSPCDLSPELTRPFRALRFWLPFKLAGTRPFAAALEEKLLLARYFHEKVSEIPGVEVGPYPDLSVVTFRYTGDGANADEVNRQLIQKIIEDQRIFVSSTTLDGKFVVRVAVLGYNSHIEDVDLALSIIRRSIIELQ